MLRNPHMLKSNSFRAQDIHIHQDLLCTAPSALSRKRERKPGTELQKEKEDKPGYTGCILCHPEIKKQKNPSGTTHEVSIEGKVSSFLNDYPYLPHEHRLYFLWSPDEHLRQYACHRYRIGDFGRPELYWLLYARREDAKRFQLPPESADRLRLIAGFNIGDLAGQSVAHFHLQSGWEVVLQPREFTDSELTLYFRELHAEDLIIFENEHYRLVAPWTPGGKYAVDFYFRGKNEITQLDDDDLRTFAVIGEAILRIYHKYIGITNVNIVMRGSVKDCRTEPLQMHFVPRVNLAAMYEILGVNVVDTFPQSIAVEFRRAHTDPNRGEILPWYELFDSVHEFDPETAFRDRGTIATGTLYQAETRTSAEKPPNPSLHRTPQKARRR
jgi:diadenosine tetraphosphate (Ap4A) HIT family hydrolase